MTAIGVTVGSMNTSARMLRLLSLLQTHRYWPGTELAGRLEVSGRTLRRDIERLRELGYSVDAVRGVAGGYQLRAGGSLPPLLLEDEEAVAIAVGLRTAAAGAVSGMEETSIQALTKVIGLMPPRLRRRIDAIQSQTDGVPWSGGPTIDAGVLTTIAQACRDDEPLRFGYQAPPRDGRSAELTQRRVEPYRLVSLGRRWYLVAYDRDRQDWRSFRVDRISDAEATGQRFRPRELPAEDAPAFVRAGIRSRSHRYDVRVRFAAPADLVDGYVGRWGTVERDGDAACRMSMSTDTLDWPMMVLAHLDCDFTVDGPPELADLVAAAAARFARSR
jgi:predicted DNA-binding transcriptional regulator YafY